MVVTIEFNLFLEHKGNMKVELLNFRNDDYTPNMVAFLSVSNWDHGCGNRKMKIIESAKFVFFSAIILPTPYCVKDVNVWV